jgi:DNA-binding MarR family transcriptional regulator
MQVHMGDDPQARIERELTLLVRRAQKVHLRSEAPAEALDRAAYSILGTLHDEGPLRCGALADRFQLDASTVSRQVAGLVQAGLVVKEVEADDRRAWRLRLTRHGEDSLEATRSARRRIVRELLGSWSPQDRAVFAGLLEQFNAGLETGLAGSAPAYDRDRPVTEGQSRRS